jgi:hypothetical protein
MCPICYPYGKAGLVPEFLPRPPEEYALPPRQRPPQRMIWVPCSHCHGGTASCCDDAGSRNFTGGGSPRRV